MGNSKQQAIIAVAATIVLSGCGLIKPRDAGYFRFHAEEARLVVKRCERGQETGSDCETAAQAVAEHAAAAGRQSGRLSEPHTPAPGTNSLSTQQNRNTRKKQN